MARFDWDESLSSKAMAFALTAHQHQRRKYTGNPYCEHLAEVAGIVATMRNTDDYPTHDMSIAVAWLHDCKEDQGVTDAELECRFGRLVAAGVDLLTNSEKGNRETRKRLENNRLALAPGWVQTIKCADIFSNVKSIVLHDPKFAAVYLPEKRLQLSVMIHADPRIRNLARDVVEEGMQQIRDK